VTRRVFLSLSVTVTSKKKGKNAPVGKPEEKFGVRVSVQRSRAPHEKSHSAFPGKNL
jgi:hypothetical protein